MLKENLVRKTEVLQYHALYADDPEITAALNELSASGPGAGDLVKPDACCRNLFVPLHIDGGILKEYAGVASEVTIQNTVTGIGEGAFRNCPSLQTINILEEVVSIEESAFQGTGLREIQIPASVSTLGSGVFQDCHSLNSVMIPAGTDRIAEACFFGCRFIEEVRLTNWCTRVEGRAVRIPYSTSAVSPTGITPIRKRMCGKTNRFFRQHENRQFVGLLASP